MDKVLLAYANLNEALSNNRVNKTLVLDLADGLENDLGLTCKVKPFQFSDDLTEVGLLQAEALSSYAKNAIENLNYKNSKEIYDNTKSIIVRFLKMYNDIKKNYSANVEVVDKLINYYENQAMSEFTVADDGSLLESVSENKSILKFSGWNSHFLIDILKSVDNNEQLLRSLEEICNKDKEDNNNSYSPFLNLLMNLIGKLEVENHKSVNLSVVGKPVYAVDIINSIVNDTFSKELENILDSVLSYFYSAYYGQEEMNILHKAEEVSADKEKVLEEQNTNVQILNCFNDRHGLQIFTFLIKLIYSNKKEKKE